MTTHDHASPRTRLVWVNNPVRSYIAVRCPRHGDIHYRREQVEQARASEAVHSMCEGAK